MGNDLISAAGLIHIIEESRQSALKKVNEELIKMYWKVGEFLSKETERASYGDAYIDEISREIRLMRKENFIYAYVSKKTIQSVSWRDS